MDDETQYDPDYNKQQYGYDDDMDDYEPDLDDLEFNPDDLDKDWDSIDDTIMPSEDDFNHLLRTFKV